MEFIDVILCDSIMYRLITNNNYSFMTLLEFLIFFSFIICYHIMTVMIIIFFNSRYLYT